MSKLVKPINAFVGETVRIRWHRAIQDPTTTAPIYIQEILEEEHTAPPPDVWQSRLTKREDA